MGEAEDDDAKKKAQSILDQAPGTLESVDHSYIFAIKESRDFPRFEFNELVQGALLGKGGFSGVHEIDKILLEGGGGGDDSSSEETKKEKKEQAANPPASPPPKNDLKDETGGVKKQQDDHHHKDHYNVGTAREFMRKHYLRYGSARYAIKKLKPDLGVVHKARGAVDLAIEIKFLSTIWHPNIIKMRGYSKTPRVDEETFLILDRLYGTLDDKIEMWESKHAVTKACCGGVSEKDPAMLQLLQERLLVAYDLSSAIKYLHDLRLLYRDIKPENIGFDIRGDVKLFDFGLMKSLERSNKIKDSYGYKLSGKTGSIPYMAPEVALGKPYDREADVYSFAVLLWEIVSLDWAYNGYDTRQYFIQVCAHNQRLPVKRSWPAMVRVIIEEGWDPNPQKRPNMSRIGTLLRGELADLTSDNAILNRTQHLMNKSRRSRHFLDNSRQGRRGSGMGGSSGGRRSSVGLDGSTNGRRTSMKGDRSTRDMFLGGDVCGTSDNP